MLPCSKREGGGLSHKHGSGDATNTQSYRRRWNEDTMAFKVERFSLEVLESLEKQHVICSVAPQMNHLGSPMSRFESCDSRHARYFIILIRIIF